MRQDSSTSEPLIRSALVFFTRVLPLTCLMACGSVAPLNQSAALSVADHQRESEITASAPTAASRPEVQSADTATAPVVLHLPDLPSADKGGVDIRLPDTPIEDVREVEDRLPILHKVDLTISQRNLWRRIRNSFAIPNLHSPLVEDRENWYANRPEYFERIAERCKLYLHYVVDELEKRHMPTELALLPIVESAYNPMAYSSAHASGLWQFIPSTGKNYNLEQNWWYDGRRDIVASTQAALDYLEFLYEMHGDWQLALASYNWGENAVARAIERNRVRGLPTDYSSLGMPRETRYYVPTLQALKNIISNPKFFGIDLDPIPNQPYFVTVDTGDIDIKVAAKLAEMSVEDLIALNPAHKRPVILARYSEALVLPADRVEIFQANLESRSRPLMPWETYRLKRGDKLARLARQHGITLAKLKDINSITRRTRIKPGMLLLLPIGDSKIAVKPIPVTFSALAGARKIIHLVKAGNTLSGIAKRYHVSVSKLRSWNRIGNHLLVGQKIVIYLGGNTAGKKTIG